MRRLGLRAIQAKKFTVTTDSDHGQPVAPDLIEQEPHSWVTEREVGE
ncbi:MAG: hypothetical protein U5K76_08505 [Woeseiaceae bacterium]|nr:hypothetical protein [Woeseiaceae bacterium]